MKTTQFINKIFAIGLLALAALFTSCKDDDNVPDLPKDTVYGLEVTVGKGKARSFIKLGEGGSPIAIGFLLSKLALESLPHEDESFVLALPAEKSKTRYDHISLDWASHGHAPEGIYNKPHFDMHFYMISGSERAGIKHQSEEIERAPEARFLPATYFSQPGEGVPQMGKHWVDATAPELNGKPFTTTFIYGSYDGRVIFHEPMMTRDWLLTKQDTVMAIPQPEAFQETGLYPAKYSVQFDEDKQQYIISLIELSLKQK